VIEFKISAPGLQAAEQRFSQAGRIYREELATGARAASQILQKATEREAPGSIGESITVVTEPALHGVRMWAESRDKPYVRYVVEGTRAHEIRPRVAKALRFVYQGRVVFARSVQHPGTQPNPFFARALEKARLPLRRNYQATNRRILLRLTRGR
jgi:hypothetical protein